MSNDCSSITANDIDDADKQHAILLSSVGPTTYRLTRNLLAPAKPTEKTFKEIVEAVQAHHPPRPSVMVQRFNFHSHSSQSGESIFAYVAELRKLSEHCKFGDTLNDMLRDRLACGINDQRTAAPPRRTGSDIYEGYGISPGRGGHR